MSNVVVLDSKHVWGYWSANDTSFPEDDRKDPVFRRIIAWQNLGRIVSIFLSPIIGLVRAIVAIVLLIATHKVRNQNEYKKGLRRFLWTSLGRGVLEILCLGPILGIVDAVKTVQHHEMCCYKKA